ncbi:copper resistance protein B [Rhizorhabdus dicambivorans]|uniref:Copper resistance protein B n=1 Tax=Rhizorhabdus dicambivorans TaxID=1850238 RepID=A0A2A4FZR3_9SPHN|nr:copper resistance protein B [Rhizorhabdus dicambivorans]ATE65814.1 copper resistance protein B [Rhizorhabdus dicambivorans]PCE42927.1 copper resistance protein B [Rhizorhabdus dicambivorans]
MIRTLFAASLLAAATPAAAQHADHTGHTGHMGHAMPASDAAPSCTPEHAAMGHCKPAPAAAAPVRPAVDPSCPPEHAAMGHCEPTAPSSSGAVPTPPAPPSAGPSAAASSGPEYAADGVWGADVMAPVRKAVYTEHGAFRGSKLLIDRLEHRSVDGRDGYAWEGEGWYGGDYDRLWVKTEGEGGFGGAIESAEVQALWSRAIGPWFNLQTGLRYDFRPRPDRAHLAMGVQGLAPYWFEVDVAAFLSDRGDLTARLEAEYDQRITNRLILQPSAEIELSAQNVPSVGISAGLSTIEAGLRLRYEVVPEFAPYLGLEYERAFGKTADSRRADGEKADSLAFVIGLRAWF